MKHGHEIALHGYIHERANELAPEQEKYWLDRAVSAYRKHVGGACRGWRAPSFAFSDQTLSFLLSHGFRYDSSLMGDDIPYAIKCDAGSLIELPTDWTLDDWPHYIHNRDFGYLMPISAPQRAVEVFRAEFDAAWEYGALWVSVWHPFVSGRLSRLAAVLNLLEYMGSKGGVWFARLDEVYAHVDQQVRQGQWQPRVEALPLNRTPLPVFAEDPYTAF